METYGNLNYVSRGGSITFTAAGDINFNYSNSTITGANLNYNLANLNLTSTSSVFNVNNFSFNSSGSSSFNGVGTVTLNNPFIVNGVFTLNSQGTFNNSCLFKGQTTISPLSGSILMTTNNSGLIVNGTGNVTVSAPTTTISNNFIITSSQVTANTALRVAPTSGAIEFVSTSSGVTFSGLGSMNIQIPINFTDLKVNNTFTVGANAVTINNVGDVVVNGTVNANAGITTNSLIVGNTTITPSNFSTNDNSPFTVYSGIVSITSRDAPLTLTSTYGITMNGTLTLSSGLIVNNSFQVNGQTNFNGEFYIGNTFHSNATGDISITRPVSIANSLSATSFSIGATASISSSGNSLFNEVLINSVSNSSYNSGNYSGPLLVNGGAAIKKDLYVGGNIFLGNINLLSTSSTNVYVSLNGDDVGGSGSFLRPYKTLTKALDVIQALPDSSFYTIIVLPGIYPPEDLVITKNRISIVGSSGPIGIGLIHTFTINPVANLEFSLKNCSIGFNTLDTIWSSMITIGGAGNFKVTLTVENCHLRNREAIVTSNALSEGATVNFTDCIIESSSYSLGLYIFNSNTTSNIKRTKTAYTGTFTYGSGFILQNASGCVCNIQDSTFYGQITNSGDLTIKGSLISTESSGVIPITCLGSSINTISECSIETTASYCITGSVSSSQRLLYSNIITNKTNNLISLYTLIPNVGNLLANSLYSSFLTHNYIQRCYAYENATVPFTVNYGNENQWVTRRFNSVNNLIEGSSYNSGNYQFTLPAGKYKISGKFSYMNGTQGACRIFSVTGNAPLINGIVSINGTSTIDTILEFSTAITITIQTIIENIHPNNGILTIDMSGATGAIFPISQVKILRIG